MARFDVFLSYHWRDHASVEALARRLRDAGLSVFLDRWFLTPGTNWLAALEATLADCGAVAVCLGQNMGPWQAREQYSALERQASAEKSGQVFPVIPVLLPGSEPPLGFLRQNTWVDLRAPADDAATLAILVKAIRGEPPGPEPLAPPDARAQICPYRGLLYFREQDADFFFGREAAVEQLAAALAQHSMVALVGASGAGKSSVVRAGLIPLLRQKSAPVWEIATLVPGDRPLYALADAVLPLLEPEAESKWSEVDRLAETSKLARLFESQDTDLRDVVDRVLAKQPGTERLLLVVDQWEELFTHQPKVSDGADRDAQQKQIDTIRRRFIDMLLDATKTSRLSLVLTLRGDFFDRAVTAYRPLSDRLQGAQVNLGPMNEAELRLAIEQPAVKLGLRLEPGLVDTLLADALGEPGHLPLLEFVLRQLWEQRQGGVLHRDAYTAMGRISGAIAQKADALYQTLTPADQDALHRLFLRLVRPGEGELDTRRRAAMSDFDPQAAGLIKKLSDERLLVTARTGNVETVEVAHEALIQNWDLLRGWVDADRQFIAWRQDLNASAAKWRDAGRGADRLLRGLPLAQAKEWGRKRPDELSELERDFIQAGARRQRRIRWVVGGMSVGVLAVVGVLFAQALVEQQRADLAREDAEDLVEFMTYDLRDKLLPIGRLDLMDGVNKRVNAYFEKDGWDRASANSQKRRAANLNNRGDTLLAQGQLDAARKAYDQSLAIAEALAARDPANAQWQRDLYVSHKKIGDVLVAQGDGPGALAAYRKSLTIREALAARDPANTQWQRDLSVSHENIGNVLVAQGDRPGALAAYRRSLAIAEALAARDPANIQWQRDLSISHEKTGNVLVTEGDVPGALAAYRRSLTIREALAARDPANTGWQRDLSISDNKIGDVLVTQGDGPGALAAYRRSLTIREALVARDPANTQWQRDLSISHEKAGNVLVTEGDVPGALAAYRRSLTIREALAARDPANTGWQRDLSISDNKIGDVLVTQGDGPGALAAYRKGLAIAETLTARDPANTQWQHDLSASHERIGDVLVAQGDRPGALAAYRKGLTIREALAARDSANTELQRDLSASHEGIGDVLVAQGDGPVALEAYRKSLTIREALVARDPANTEWQRDLSVSHERIGDVLVAQRDRTGALGSYRKSLMIHETLAARDPANTGWQRDLWVSHNKIGEILAAQGSGREALATHQKALVIAEALVERDTSNTLWQRDLSVSHNLIGNVLETQGDGPGALAAYRKSLTIREALAARDPANTEWQRDLAVSYSKLGSISENQKQKNEAVAYFEKMEAISVRLAKLDPTNVQWQKDLQAVRAELKALKGK